MKLTSHIELNRTAYNAEQAHLRLRVKCNGRFIYSSNIGYVVDIAKWDSVRRRCAPKTTHGPKSVPAVYINKAINRLSLAVQTIIDNFTLANKAPTAAQFKTALEALINPDATSAAPTESTVVDAWASYLEIVSAAHSWSANTKKKATSVANSWCAFRPTLKINALTSQIIDEWIATLFDAGMRNSSVAKHVKILRSFLRWCTKRQLYNGTLANSYELRLKSVSNLDKQIVYLEWPELIHFLNFDFGHLKHLTQVRDVFCFCCFSSLRYSDVAQLRRADIFDDAIHITSQKTSECLTIELNKYTSAILARYANLAFPNDCALPVISLAKYNQYIHEAARVAGLNRTVRHSYFVKAQRIDTVSPLHEALTSHAARRTFIVQSLRLGIPAEVVMKWTGHESYEAMKPYIAIVQELRRTSMSLFDA